MVASLASRIRYPIYVISKGRWKIPYTASFLLKEAIDFFLVVEPQEFDDYKKKLPEANILKLPFSNLGEGSIPARNWCWQHSKNQMNEKHWILDDNIRGIRTFKEGKRVKCRAKEAFISIESFTDRYENIALSSMNYSMFAFGGYKIKPFILNTRCYSCILIDNELPFRWRGRYNEDTDLCLQALTNNKCTVNINVFLIDKMQTMSCEGGNTSELYQGNGRLKMALSLEYQWKHFPGLVKTIRRFGRSQHFVNWRIFKTPLKLKAEYGKT